MRVTLLSYTCNPEKIVSAAAKLCYSDSKVRDLMNNLTEAKAADFIAKLSNIGHESPFEHVSFTFAIEGMSRTCLAQLTRHRIASYSVQSQRYIDFSNPTYVSPPEITSRPEIDEIYTKAINDSIDAYKMLTKKLTDAYMNDPVFVQMNPSRCADKAKKKALEDARFVLPNAIGCSLIVTMNCRSLMNFFSLRCCNRAQWEIRSVAKEMLAICYSIAPALFKNAGPSCVRGRCVEGYMTCKKAKEMIEEINTIKEVALNTHVISAEEEGKL